LTRHLHWFTVRTDKGGMGELHNHREQEQDHLPYPLYSSAQPSGGRAHGTGQRAG